MSLHGYFIALSCFAIGVDVCKSFVYPIFNGRGLRTPDSIGLEHEPWRASSPVCGASTVLRQISCLVLRGCGWICTVAGQGMVSFHLISGTPVRFS